MSIVYRSGNILETEAWNLVCPVNLRGVMGAGLAKQFADRWPGVLERYRQALARRLLREAIPYAVELDALRVVVLFPTKRHWRDPARLRDIDLGLAQLGRLARDGGFAELAIPALGCGLGGLAWEPVRELIERAFAQHPTRAIVYVP